MTSPRFELMPVGQGIASFRIATDENPYFSLESLDALRAIARSVEVDSELRAIIIEGGHRQFCAGADRQTLLRPDAAATIDTLVGEVARTVLSFPVPTIAAMSGHAIGGGFIVGLWCDTVIMAEESLYSANFLELGFTPGMGSTFLLAEVFGAQLARELLLTGRALTGAELKALVPSLSHRIVPRARVTDDALALAHELAGLSPPAVRLFKKHLHAQRGAALEKALENERRMHEEIFSLDETRASVSRNYASGSER